MHAGAQRPPGRTALVLLAVAPFGWRVGSKNSDSDVVVMQSTEESM
jgi:hypothetical protein